MLDKENRKFANWIRAILVTRYGNVHVHVYHNPNQPTYYQTIRQAYILLSSSNVCIINRLLLFPTEKSDPQVHKGLLDISIPWT